MAVADREAQPLEDGQQIDILIVDDCRDTVTSMARLLEHSGYSVQTAIDGPTAIKTILAQRPRAAILDLAMPKMDGNAVARRLRGDPTLGGLRLVAHSGYGRQIDVDAALAAGFDKHLLKPVPIGVMIAALEAMGIYSQR
jgi:CheY-like chemotaxis protein